MFFMIPWVGVGGGLEIVGHFELGQKVGWVNCVPYPLPAGSITMVPRLLSHVRYIIFKAPVPHAGGTPQIMSTIALPTMTAASSWPPVHACTHVRSAARVLYESGF